MNRNAPQPANCEIQYASPINTALADIVTEIEFLEGSTEQLNEKLKSASCEYAQGPFDSAGVIPEPNPPTDIECKLARIKQRLQAHRLTIENATNNCRL